MINEKMERSFCKAFFGDFADEVYNRHNPSDSLCQCEDCLKDGRHSSDCAVHNGELATECDCGQRDVS